MALPMLAMLGVVMGQALVGVEYVYDVEVLADGKMQSSKMAIAAEGSRYRFEGSQLPFVMVMSDTRQEATWSVPKRNTCYRLAYQQFPLLQVKALEKFKADVLKSPDLTDTDRAKIVQQAQTKIDELRATKPKKRLYAWEKRASFGQTCELYTATEDGVEVGRVCLLVDGKPPKFFELNVAPGEWWQGMGTHFAAGRALVYFEGSRGGVVVHRATLATKQKKSFEPTSFNFGPDCRSGLEM